MLLSSRPCILPASVFLHSLAAVRQLFSLSNFLLSPFDSWRGLICHPAGDESDASHPDLYAAANEI